ncbi:AEC family transporter [Haloferax mediterranei ATCC 33500]|uniref:Transporter n=1 Tax=Haloferax mediterranei (strain ATCC 33500 / DSM 1411 / JCM 8866 / NBRC 14739 / NCIMB 2177 / R-4) TaxID=523841 RepID=I3R2B6_HALMT|nr:AEC family transporter [Haloferax mediterranei]AFK18376.2 transporter [Haloferax mediterranei ATCC 33500]AHZ22228.1 permease [Haloferax mediterranei ATCC 33500]EMA02349.1 transporter [Haloferax mediterranei ATCC 33500]MDX5988468.1 AEC family transporter [Haloferax mediterranei ATCC 33500]QCQ74887.1 AEC family transporter [Haloferax mediterranei ATCC 33500]
MSLLSIFVTALLPILAIGAVGFLLGRVRDVDPEPLNTVTVYVLAPALVFYSLATTELAGSTLATITGGVVVYHVVMILVAAGVARLLGISEPLLGALVLVAAFPNSGNYGVPVSSFAFGDTGRSAAVVYLAVQGVLIYTLGVYIAGRGAANDAADHSGWLVGIKRILRIPLIYAVVVALVVRWLGVVPPTDLAAMQTLKLVGDSSIPMMLLILGIQLAGADLGSTLSEVGLVAGLKMVVAPAIAVGVALVAGFGDLTVARTFVLESAMPAAVTPLILVGEFGNTSMSNVSVAEFVSAAVFATTLLSVPVLTVLIFLLDSGFVV